MLDTIQNLNQFCRDLIYGLIYSDTLRWRHAKKTHSALLDLCVWNRWPASVIPKMLNEQVGNPWLDALTTLEYIFVIYRDNITRSGMYSFTIAYQWYPPWSNGYIANITQSLCMNLIKWYVVYFEINILQRKVAVVTLLIASVDLRHSNRNKMKLRNE